MENEQVTLTLQHSGSEDLKVSQAGTEVRTGWRWRVVEAVDVAESRLQRPPLVGAVAHG